MLTLESRFQGCLLGAWLAWQRVGDTTWGVWFEQGCRYWTGQSTQAPVATMAGEALLLLLPGLLLGYSEPAKVAEMVLTAGLPEVVSAWAQVLHGALQGQRGDPLADRQTWPELAQSVADFQNDPDDPVTTLTLAHRQGRSALALGLTGWLLGAYGGATAFPAHWVVQLPDTRWREMGTALLARWAGVRFGRGPWAVGAL